MRLPLSHSRSSLFHPLSSILYSLAALAALAALTGCERRDMYEQPRYDPVEKSDFFEDGSSARPLVPGAVARTEIYPDRQSAPGIAPAPDGQGFPADFPTGGDELRVKLERGQERFNIYCAVCHGAAGEGNGMIVQRGFTPPPSFVVLPADAVTNPVRYQREQYLQTVPPRHVYDVVSNGFGAMYSYAERVSPDDRWAIAAYVRALQVSRRAFAAATPAEAPGGTPPPPAVPPGEPRRTNP